MKWPWKSNQVSGATSNCDLLPQSVKDAAIRGNQAPIEEALKAGLSVDATDEHENTLLMLAAVNGHHDLVRQLIGWKADLGAKDSYGSRAIWEAMGNGHLSTGMLLLEIGDGLDDMPSNIIMTLTRRMDLAEQSGESAVAESLLNTAKFLLGKGANPDGTDPLDEGDAEDFEDGESFTPLIWCARHRLYAMAQLLISHGANPRAAVFGVNAYTHAANQGDDKMMSIIRAAGG